MEIDRQYTDRKTKKVVFVLFFTFFILYQKYNPYFIQKNLYTVDTEYIFRLFHFIINQTLGIVHEGGHGICYILQCPIFIGVINGTIFQWLFPLGIAYYYKKRGNITAFYIAIFILGISVDYSSWYMSTVDEGPYIPADKAFLGVDGLHDFYYIFSTLGVLPYASFISGMTKVFSLIIMLFSLFGLFLSAFFST